MKKGVKINKNRLENKVKRRSEYKSKRRLKKRE